MKKVLKNFIVLTIVLILIAYCNISIATNMSDLKNEKNEIKDEIVATEKKLDEISEEKGEILDQVENLINQISGYQGEIDELNTKISSLQTKINSTQKQIQEDEIEYDKQQKALDARLVAMYEAGETSYLDFLLSSASIVDFISSYYLVSEVAEYDNEMLQQLEEHKTKLEKEKSDLESDKKELDLSKTTLTSKQQSLKVAKNEKEQYVSKLSDTEKELEKQLSELATHEQSISKKIATLQAEYDRQAAARANSGSSSGTSNMSGGATSSMGFGWPVANPVIGTRYGVSGRYWSSGHHTGVDFRASTGTPVYSVGDGQVVDTGYNSAYGNFVEVYHGSNIYSFYAHASRVIVSVGQYVSKGQQVMYSGATGNVTGPHLHFEIRTPGPRYANCVNPMNYLP